MPRPTPPKLHGKGKPVALQKSHKVDKDIDEIVDNDSTKNFRLELIWCIQQLERVLIEKKANEKQLQETWKVLAVLKNNNQPIIRKRQLMRTHLGDYRAKMLEEEKKLIKSWFLDTINTENEGLVQQVEPVVTNYSYRPPKNFRIFGYNTDNRSSIGPTVSIENHGNNRLLVNSESIEDHSSDRPLINNGSIEDHNNGPSLNTELIQHHNKSLVNSESVEDDSNNKPSGNIESVGNSWRIEASSNNKPSLNMGEVQASSSNKPSLCMEIDEAISNIPSLNPEPNEDISNISPSHRFWSNEAHRNGALVSPGEVETHNDNRPNVSSRSTEDNIRTSIRLWRVETHRNGRPSLSSREVEAPSTNQPISTESTENRSNNRSLFSIREEPNSLTNRPLYGRVFVNSRPFWALNYRSMSGRTFRTSGSHRSLFDIGSSRPTNNNRSSQGNGTSGASSHVISSRQLFDPSFMRAYRPSGFVFFRPSSDTTISPNEHLMASKIKISESSVKPKAIFLRKATSLTTGGGSFPFNFDSNSEQTEKSDAENINDSSLTRNSECANDEASTNGEALTSKDPVADTTGTLSNNRQDILTAIAETTAIEEPEVGVSVAAGTEEPVVNSATSESSENPKNLQKSFKFIPSKTPFMFNFSHTNEDKN